MIIILTMTIAPVVFAWRKLRKVTGLLTKSVRSDRWTPKIQQQIQRHFASTVSFRESNINISLLVDLVSFCETWLCPSEVSVSWPADSSWLAGCQGDLTSGSTFREPPRIGPKVLGLLWLKQCRKVASTVILDPTGDGLVSFGCCTSTVLDTQACTEQLYWK